MIADSDEKKFSKLAFKRGGKGKEGEFVLLGRQERLTQKGSQILILSRQAGRERS